MWSNQRLEDENGTTTPAKPRRIHTLPTAGQQSCDAPLGTHVGRFATLDLEFELEQLEIETGLDAIENIDEIEKFTKIV